MKRIDYLSKIADNLVKQVEASRNLSKFNTKSTGLYTLLTGVPEAEILKKEATVLTLELKDFLIERLNFFENKKEFNGNIPVLKKEIAKCVEILENKYLYTDINYVKECINWNKQIRDKYGF